MDSFLLPRDVISRPVAEGEVRLLRPEGDRDTAYLYNRQTRDLRQMLPHSCVTVPLLVLGLDQGSVGAAGQVFAEEVMGALVHTKWDKFHRVVRDVKLAAQRASGVFSIMYSSYLWSVNKRPFGAGQFGEKKRCLNVFVATHSRESPLWAKYGRLIADDRS